MEIEENPNAFTKFAPSQPSGLKLDAGKPPMELLDASALEEVARVLDFGRKKYAAHNWRKGLSYGRLLGAALRHTFAVVNGEDIDPENGRHHAAEAICELMFLLRFQLDSRTDLDDRYRHEG